MIVNIATDKPWSQYFCCMLVGNTDFVRNHPVATKRVAARHPESHRPLRHRTRNGPRGGWSMRGFTQRYDYALQTLTEIPYASWREFDPEDTMRFYALRLHEVGHDQVHPERSSSPRAPTGAS